MTCGEKQEMHYQRYLLSILSIHVMLIFNSPVPVIVHLNYETNRWTIREDILYLKSLSC